MTPAELQKFLDDNGLYEDEAAIAFAVTPKAVDHWLKGRREVPPLVQKLETLS